MKRIVLISMTLLLAAAGLHAQEILARFSTDRITCKYSSFSSMTADLREAI